MTVKKDTVEKERLKMAALCARSEQCSFDIRRKLSAKLSADETEEILKFLKDKKFIDDTRFAKNFASYKVRFNRWGRNKIKIHLKGKQIPEAIINEALKSLDAKEYTKQLLQSAILKSKNLDLSDASQSQKLLNHLLSRGFTYPESTKAFAYLKKNQGES